MQPETATFSSKQNDTSKRKFLVSALNGTTLYVLAYYFVWGLHQLAKVQISTFYHLHGTCDPSRILYTLDEKEWWRTAVIAVYGIGPLVCLLLGIGAFRWYWKSERARRGNFKLLLLWVVFHSCNAVFGALLADSFTQTGFWNVPDRLLGLGNIMNILLALLAGLAQLGLGYFGAVAFLQAHDSKTVMRYPNRQLMVVSTLIVPWIAGGLFIALSKLPYLMIQEVLHLLMMGLLVTPLALGCLNEVFSDTVKRPQATNVAWGLVGLAMLAALVWRLALSPPVAFG